MDGYYITVVNKTGEQIPGRSVTTMLFQTRPDPLNVGSYSSAWKVDDIQYPGTLGPIFLPEKVQFAVFDKTPQGDERLTGPFDIQFGQTANVAQKKAADAPKVTIRGDPVPGADIKVNNDSGNVKPLEMALFKNGRKLISFKDVNPADAVYLNLNPVIYIADVEGIHQGEDFLAAEQASKSTQFKLKNDIPRFTIQITQSPSGELKFSLLE